MQIPPVQAPAGGVIVSGPYGSYGWERVGCVGKTLTFESESSCVCLLNMKYQESWILLQSYC